MTIKLVGSSSGSVALDAPASTTSGANIEFKLPVADGTAGQVLQTDGSGNLSWVTSTDDGSWVKLSSTTVSSDVGSLTFSNSITGAFDTYKTYVVTMTSLKPATDDVTLQMRVVDSNGTYQASQYDTVIHAFADGDHGYSTQTRWQLIRHGIGNGTGEDCQALFYFSNFEANKRLRVRGQAVYQSNNGSTQVVDVGGTVNNTTAVTGLVFFMSSGDIDSGVFTLYGIKN